MGEYISSDNENYYDDENYYDNEDSFDGLDNDDSYVASFKPPPSTKVITKESLLAAQREDLRQVMDLLSVREHHARTLLIHYRWEVEKLLAVFVEKGKNSLFSEAGAIMVEKDTINSSNSSTVMCVICMEDVPCASLTKMDCGHCFCNDCWTEHFIVKIREGQSKRVRCMAHKCNTICDETIVRTLVGKTHPDLAEKFDGFLLESYIEDNKMVKWCPSVPHCGNAIRVEVDEFCEVECSCGLQFCFSCGSEAHSPCSCLMWELWSKKCRDESETVNWMTANTKSCPKCLKPVEKNGGCNLVYCICGQPFCWLCGGATGRDHTWTSISGHSCGRFKEEKEIQIARAERDLHRYMHYHNRYKAHTDSFKHESNLMNKIQEKVTSLKNKGWTAGEFSWLTNGLYRLFRSRRVLSYTYPFAYYMFGEELFNGEMDKEQREMKQNLFEDQQQQLEQNVERLSKFMEMEFDSYEENQIVEMKMQILALTPTIDKFCMSLYECIENELLVALQYSTHNIAPYRSQGIEKAAELLTSLDQKVTNVDNSPSDFEARGVTEEVDLSSSFSKSRRNW